MGGPQNHPQRRFNLVVNWVFGIREYKRLVFVTPFMYNDTICAPASSPFHSAIALIRISGSGARRFAKEYFSREARLSHSVALRGFIRETGSPAVDDVMVTFFESPRSYTGEDLLEISCHGNPLIVQKIISLACSSGIARYALPGEFTQRAFLNGKLDLTAAEAVNQIISARSSWEIDAALAQMHGLLRKRIDSLRERLITARADIEAGIDFSTEDIAFTSREALRELILALRDEIIEIAARCRAGDTLRQGIDLAIIGKPNAGKSSLLNLLVNRERAIVSEIPGTTRDVIVESMQIDGVRLNIMDTAGIRPTVDKIEQIGIEKSKESFSRAHIVLLVFDNTTGFDYLDRTVAELADASKCIGVINKSDAPPCGTFDEASALFGSLVAISAKSGSNFAGLESRIREKMRSTLPREDYSYLADARIITLLEKGAACCSEAADAIDAQMPDEIIALEFDRVIESLESITGRIVPDDVLGSIFSRFCVGK